GGGNRYTNLVLSGVDLTIQGKHRQRAGRDAQGDLAFAAKPQDAPVVHFDGPLAFELFDYCHTKSSALVRGTKPGAFAVSVGTRGVGNGTFAYLLPPANFEFEPLADIEFAHKNPKEKTISVQARLKSVDEECTSFLAKVRVPDDASGDKAKVKLSFA